MCLSFTYQFKFDTLINRINDVIKRPGVCNYSLRIDEMHSFLSRFIYGFMRRVFSLFGILRWNTITLFQWEVLPKLKFQVVETVSGGQLVSHIHPISGFRERFVFQDRHVVSAKDTILDLETGVIFDLSGRILNETSNYSRDYLLSTAFPRPFSSFVTSHIHEPSLFLPNNGFFHWLYEDLPNFLRILDLYPRSQYVMVSKSAKKYVRDFAFMKDFTLVESNRYIRFDELHFMTYGQSSGWPDPRDVLLLRENIGITKPPRPHKKIYVSRKNSSRSPSFELKLETALHEEGWEILYAEKLNFEEQIEIFSQARVICGVGGANLANVIWADPKAILIELSDSWFSPCFSRMSSYLEYQYHLVEFRDGINFDTNSLLRQIVSFS